jgi:hypothetical protein
MSVADFDWFLLKVGVRRDDPAGNQVKAKDDVKIQY